jgi:hypothetical protein
MNHPCEIDKLLKNGLALKLGFSLFRSSSNALIDNKSFELIGKAASRTAGFRASRFKSLTR